MTTLLADLDDAITSVLTRHSRLELKTDMLKAVSGVFTEPANNDEFCAQVCRLFNATQVAA